MYYGMVDYLLPATIGLWSWLFVEVLTQEGGIFRFLHRIGPTAWSIPSVWSVYRKYLTCATCHAGAFALMATVASCVFYAAPLSHLFHHPVIAMAIARVMTLKFS